jgi:phage terminase Nu1 subunit (DNA packaging protein)
MKKMSGPIEVSTAQLAEAFGVTTRRVAQLVEERVLVRTSRGTFDLGESVRSYLSYRESKLAAKLGGGPLHEAKRRYLEARTRAAELAAEERTGKLVPASQVEASFAAIATAVRSALLSLPKVCAARLGMTKGVVEAEALLRAAVEEALSELSRSKVSIDGQPQ